MIDESKPIRTQRTKRRLYHLGYEEGWLVLDFRPDGHWRSGIRFSLDGFPRDEGCPLGPVENFKEDGPFVEVVDVEEKRSRERFNAHVQDELGDSELFGLF